MLVQRVLRQEQAARMDGVLQQIAPNVYQSAVSGAQLARWLGARLLMTMMLAGVMSPNSISETASWS